MVEVDADRRFPYQAMGEGYRRTAAIGGSGLQPGPDGRTCENRPVIPQHFGLALSAARSFPYSVTRWAGPKILQFDHLLIPPNDRQRATTPPPAGGVFLRFAQEYLFSQ